MTFEELLAKYPEVFAHPEVCSCPPGWLPVVTEFVERLRAEHPGTQIVQCKEKFGGLRLYLEKATNEAGELAREYEFRALGLCQACGAPGRKTTTARGWVRTACSEHAG